jgi:hypothetical protein
MGLFPNKIGCIGNEADCSGDEPCQATPLWGSKYPEAYNGGSSCSSSCSTKIVSSDRVSYTGPNLPCTGINTCTSLTVVIQKIDEILCDLINGGGGGLVPHNQLEGLQGGSAELDQYIHLTEEEYGFVKPTYIKVNDFSNYDDGIYQIVEEPGTGKMYVYGAFSTYKGETANKLLKINEDGTRDTDWLGTGTLNTQYFTEPLHVNQDGTVFFGAFFTNFNGNPHNRLVKLLPNGLEDPSFNIGTGFNNGVVGISVDEPNQAIYVIGYFTSYNGVGRSRIAKLDFNGNLDTTFLPGDSFSGGGILPIGIIEIDGSLFVSGYFTAYQGNTSQRIVRINKTTGAYEGGFNPPTFNVGNNISIKVKEHQNKILVHGGFTEVGGQHIRRLVRLNMDGTIDSTFKVERGIEKLPTESVSALDYIPDLIIEPDDSITIPISSLFRLYRNKFIGGLIRLNAVGDLIENNTLINSPNFTIFKHSNGTYFLSGFRAYDPMGYGEYSISPIDFTRGVTYEYRGFKVHEDGKLTSSSNLDQIGPSEEETNFVSKRDVKGTVKEYVNLLPRPIYKTRVNLTPAQLLDTVANPVELIPAPGAGKIINIIGYSDYLNFNSVSYNFGTSNLWLKSNTVKLFAIEIDNSSSRYTAINPSQNAAPIIFSVLANAPIMLQADVDATQGNSVVRMIITYTIDDFN